MSEQVEDSAFADRAFWVAQRFTVAI